MGVLEARKGAEKVGFPIVGEDAKETSNIIDYDIHDEITIDNSSVLNANNDTTTGIANVIPGVNAPKLKLSTSVYIDKLEIPSVNQTLYGQGGYILRPGETSTFIRNMTSQASYGNKEIVYFNSPSGVLYSGMQIPIEGYYKIYARYAASSTTFGWEYQWRTPNGGGSQDTIWHTYETERNSSYEYETITRHFQKGEIFCLCVFMKRYTTTTLGATPDILIEIEKL